MSQFTVIDSALVKAKYGEIEEVTDTRYALKFLNKIDKAFPNTVNVNYIFSSIRNS